MFFNDTQNSLFTHYKLMVAKLIVFFLPLAIILVSVLYISKLHICKLMTVYQDNHKSLKLLLLLVVTRDKITYNTASKL